MQNLLTLLILINSPAFTEPEYSIDTLILPSVILNEPRDIIIYEPSGIQASDSVSIIYLLDGEFSRQRYEMITYEQYGKPVIGIGIINTDRNRDMLPVKQPDKFLDFIDKELIPTVERNYNIDERILFGHSFAGGFTIYAMIHKPGLFNSYIASSPTPIMKTVDAGIYVQLDHQLNHPIKFYFSFGSKDMKQVMKWCGILHNNLKSQAFKQILWKCAKHEGQTHQTNDLVSLKDGMNDL